MNCYYFHQRRTRRRRSSNNKRNNKRSYCVDESMLILPLGALFLIFLNLASYTNAAFSPHTSLLAFQSHFNSRTTSSSSSSSSKQQVCNHRTNLNYDPKCSYFQRGVKANSKNNQKAYVLSASNNNGPLDFLFGFLDNNDGVDNKSKTQSDDNNDKNVDDTNTTVAATATDSNIDVPTNYLKIDDEKERSTLILQSSVNANANNNGNDVTNVDSNDNNNNENDENNTESILNDNNNNNTNNNTKANNNNNNNNTDIEEETPTIKFIDVDDYSKDVQLLSQDELEKEIEKLQQDIIQLSTIEEEDDDDEYEIVEGEDTELDADDNDAIEEDIKSENNDSNTTWTELLKNEMSSTSTDASSSKSSTSFSSSTSSTSTDASVTAKSAVQKEKSTETTLERLGFIEEQLVAKNELDSSKRINDTVSDNNNPLQGIKQEIQKMMGKEEGTSENDNVMEEELQKQKQLLQEIQEQLPPTTIADMSTKPEGTIPTTIDNISSPIPPPQTEPLNPPVPLNGMTSSSDDDNGQDQDMEEIREKRQKAMAQDLATAAYHAELKRKAKKDKMKNEDIPNPPTIDIRELIDEEESSGNINLIDINVNTKVGTVQRNAEISNNNSYKNNKSKSIKGYKNTYTNPLTELLDNEREKQQQEIDKKRSAAYKAASTNNRKNTSYNSEQDKISNYKRQIEKDMARVREYAAKKKLRTEVARASDKHKHQGSTQSATLVTHLAKEKSKSNAAAASEKISLRRLVKPSSSSLSSTMSLVSSSWYGKSEASTAASTSVTSEKSNFRKTLSTTKTVLKDVVNKQSSSVLDMISNREVSSSEEARTKYLGTKRSEEDHNNNSSSSSLSNGRFFSGRKPFKTPRKMSGSDNNENDTAELTSSSNTRRSVSARMDRVDSDGNPVVKARSSMLRKRTVILAFTLVMLQRVSRLYFL